MDALCINQTDDKKRNEQVSKMRRIYSHAAHAVTWRGEGTPGSSLGFSLMQDLFDHLPDQGTYMVDAFQGEKRRLHWAGPVEILRQEYWESMLVVQEANSARSVTLRCGSETMKWEHSVAVQN